MLINYFNRLLYARENGDFIAAHTVIFPVELIYAMGLAPMQTETTTWMISLFTGECSDTLEAAAGLGLATEICTPHRGLAGELKDMVSFLEQTSGRKMDWNRLSETVDIMNTQLDLTREIGDLRRNVPSPSGPVQTHRKRSRKIIHAA